MEARYDFSDYEEAYYRRKVMDCVRIGTYLLKRLRHDSKAEELIKELATIDFRWDLPERELDRITEVLQDVRIWLMVNVTSL